MFTKIFDLEAERVGLAPLDSFRFNGGGKGIDEVFSDLVRYGKICLGIADQDYYSLNSKVGADLMEKYDNIKSNDVVGLVDLTPGDKIENFFKFEIFKIVISELNKSLRHSYEGCLKNLGKIEGLIISDLEIDESIWLKLDMKKEFIRENFTKINTDSASLKLFNKYKTQKTTINSKKPDGFSGLNMVKEFLNCENAKIEFENFAKSDQWIRLFESWLEAKVWFLCGDDISSG